MVTDVNDKHKGLRNSIPFGRKIANCITNFDDKMPVSNLGGKLAYRRLSDLRLGSIGLISSP